MYNTIFNELMSVALDKQDVVKGILVRMDLQYNNLSGTWKLRAFYSNEKVLDIECALMAKTEEL